MTQKLSPRIKNWEKNAALKAKFCRNSFAPSTKVWTKTGLVAIATLFALDGTGLAKQTADEVWSYNEQTQKNELKTVEHVFINEDDYITTLELFDPETRRNETITTTPEHPFYVSSKEKEPWTGAGELEVDDEIRKADGNVGIVLFVRTKLEKKAMYNLSVSDNHNFFVGDKGWLTHNSCYKKALGSTTSLIKNDPALVKAADRLSDDLAYEANDLIKKYLEGNTNPGAGTKGIFGDVYELRSRNGARVYFRKSENGGMIILGKSSKNDQKQVINVLRRLYEK